VVTGRPFRFFEHHGLRAGARLTISARRMTLTLSSAAAEPLVPKGSASTTQASSASGGPNRLCETR